MGNNDIRHGLLEMFYCDGSSVDPDEADVFDGREDIEERYREKLKPILALPGAEDGYMVGTRPLDPPVPKIAADLLNGISLNHRQLFSIRNEKNFGKFNDSKIREDDGHTVEDYGRNSVYGDMIFDKDTIEQAKNNIEKRRSADPEYSKYSWHSNNCINFNHDLINEAWRIKLGGLFPSYE